MAQYRALQGQQALQNSNTMIGPGGSIQEGPKLGPVPTAHSEVIPAAKEKQTATPAVQPASQLQAQPQPQPININQPVTNNTLPHPHNVPVQPPKPAVSSSQKAKGFLDNLFGTRQAQPKSSPQPTAALGQHDYNSPVVPLGKAAHELDYFAGLFDQLRKEGANEDFIQGMMKEAVDFNASFKPYTEGVKNFFSLDGGTDSTGLPMDRHNILPFMSNRHLGALGGVIGGKMLADSAGLDGASSYILPALGMLGGYNGLPRLMNHYKDAPGTGVHSVHPLVKAYNKQHRISL
jgi:hypothetical protein